MTDRPDLLEQLPFTTELQGGSLYRGIGANAAFESVFEFGCDREPGVFADLQLLEYRR